MEGPGPGQIPEALDLGGRLGGVASFLHPDGGVDGTAAWVRDLARSTDVAASIDFLREVVRVARRRGVVLWELVAVADLAQLLERRGGVGDELEAAQLAEFVRDRIAGISPLRSPQSLPPRTARMVRRGATWSIASGSEETSVKDAKGVHYLAHLVLRPGVEVLAVDIATGGKSLLSLGLDLVDTTAVVSYRRRIAELREDLADSESDADHARAQIIREELDAIVAELATSLGLYGRARQGGSPTEKARQSVTKALRSAVRQLDDGAPRLAAHLEVSLRTGTYCSYRPEPAAQLTWIVE